MREAYGNCPEWNTIGAEFLDFMKLEGQAQMEKRFKDRETALQALLLLDKVPSSLVGASTCETVETFNSWLPQPRLVDIRHLPVIKDLLESDVSVEVMEAQYSTRSNELRREIQIWARGIVDDSIENLRKGLEQAGLSMDLPELCLLASDIASSPIEGRKAHGHLLFRADSFFCVKVGGSIQPRTFSDIAITWMTGQISSAPFEVAKHPYHMEASNAARKLLAGHPDALTIKPGLSKQKLFKCKRCLWPEKGAAPWSSLVQHFIEVDQQWNQMCRVTTSNPIWLRRNHNLGHPILKDAFKMVDANQEDFALSYRTWLGERGYILVCRFCERNRGLKMRFRCIDDMRAHAGVHRMASPVLPGFLYRKITANDAP
ncbi:F-box protein [Ceratobasidium sp. AG-Ba]|nr:F-box protein [Ceratobasidium sp. AG-Ba]